MNSINLHIYPSSITHESRILKITKALSEKNIFAQIIIIGVKLDLLAEHERIDKNISIWRVPLITNVFPEFFIFKILKRLEWTFKITRLFKQSNVKVVNCHDLSTLPIGMYFKNNLGSKIIYDTHELETEKHGFGIIKRTVSKRMEKRLIYNVDHIQVVTESIKKWYRDKYKLSNITTIYNYPYKQKNLSYTRSDIFKKKYNIKSDQILYIYHGLMDRGRSINMLLDVFSGLSDDKHIVFMGFGPLVKKILFYSQKNTNIHFHKAVTPAKITEYTRSADIGISLTEDTCLNHRLTLANKVIEYIISGIPAISSNFPEPSKIVDKYKCGWLSYPDRNSITSLINKITVKDIQNIKENVIRMQKEFNKNINWENETTKLLYIYKNI